MSKRGDFYPIILPFEKPKIVTREEVDAWYKIRGTVIKVVHIPATASGGPGDDAKVKPGAKWGDRK